MSKTNPARRIVEIPATGTVDFDPPLRAITLGVSGTLVARAVDNDVLVTTGTLPAGTYPVEIDVLDVDASTAEQLTGWR